ncbi:ubiquitin-protein ligase E3C [Helicoverpa zea]|uniref:ubiquitin-protein ligase E3C n=1 Tax=Helicoverpa zea TaxID=7113 RepID=UPI001F55AC63|nr:ubiquitin-protein ligase E3C [Helicoverpa zea]XP_047041983.1 ubiquitin-protein ligase E3C [Helicoverpa zea]XP_047042096.1 ubiquitin-protein ligase E3C [Helicoverpa zea]XP_047042175.1 ubiquitin-protein ligase E3C [Helicoverpa zea]XP_047042250.1 ubiquitin-protein ligase E3C [Helicoverpa zea]
MYSFEGDFRRKPQQNLAGASAQRKTDRDTLIQQSQQQRQKREEHRKRLNSTVKIQAYVRSYLTRKHCKQTERDQFDSIFPRVNPDDQQMLCALVAKILFFYDDQQDYSRLVAISQLLLKQWKKVYQIFGACVQIRRVLALHLRLLRDNSEVPLAVPLRMFEVFTSTNTAEASINCDEALSIVGSTFLYLVKRGYFQDLCKLMCDKTPPLYGPSPNPPTPLSGALLDLIQRPLTLISRINIPHYDDSIMTAFASAFLCNPYPEPVEMYIIPALAHDPSKKFPFLSLVQALRDDAKFTSRVLSNDSWLLHSVLALEPPDFVNVVRNMDNSRLPNNPIVLDYFKIIAKLTVNVCNKQITYEYEDSLYSQETVADKDDDSDSENEPNPTSVREQMLLTRCIELLNEPERCVMTTCSQITEADLSEDFLDCVSEICHNLLLSHRMALHKYRLLYTLAFKPMFLRGLWLWVSSMSHLSSFGGPATPLLSALSRGLGADAHALNVHRLLAPLAVFCALFSLLIGTLHDTEFCRDPDDEKKLSLGLPQPITPAGRVHAFEFGELGSLCRTLRTVCLGLVELAYPESRPAVAGHYRDAVHADHIQISGNNQTPAWSHLFKVCTSLLRALYARDGRLQFVGAGAWPAAGAVPEGGAAVLLVAGERARHNTRHLRRPPNLTAALALSHDEGPPLTIKELRTVTILREIPFVVPFSTRVLIFQGLLAREKHDHWYEMSNFNEGPSINISVRRTHLYEDAFDKLSPDNEPDLKLKLRVQLINQAGAEEAGVDGGGLFREFLSELLKSAFDPNRGLFRLTIDNMLYPNPAVHLLYDDFPMHYYFVGRMLGKAMYENLLVELPLAEFFLGKLCGCGEADVHALASLDPALHRGLLLLRAHSRRDVPELGLDFTVLTDELGEQRIEELKPGGANIPVTAENRIEYIHLVADYKLNKQIRSQCNAFKRGLVSVVSAEWLRMFSCRELQLLISGAEVPIDIEDLKRYTQYAGGFSAQHPTVQCFWRVLATFTDDQRRQLLKFVTSCSRPPLLGFKDLQPPFCIQSAGASDRLPSSSTCMNLLKLPEFHTEEQLTEKLLYAIQAGAGFELS